MGKFERYDTRNEVFDGGEFEEEDEEGSRLPLLLVIGLLVVAAFAGVVWLAYTQGVQRGRADAPRMLVAASGPVKEAPANPGGVETPFKNLKIYQQPAPPADEDAESAPQPPTSKVAAPVRVVETASPPESSSDIAPSGAKPRMTTASQAEATHPPRALHPGSSQPAAQPANASQHMSDGMAKAEQAPAAPAGTAPAPAKSGDVALQIGAYKSEVEAKAAWQSFEHRHPIAHDYQSAIKEVDLGDKGVWFRLRLGTFADKSSALSFCDKLKADGGSCFLAR